MRTFLAILTLALAALASPRSEAACRSSRELPRETHGLYLPVPLSSQRELPRMVDLARRSGVNMLVVDVKDATGRVSLTEAAAIPLVTMHEKTELIDMQELQAFRKENGGWLVARVTMFLDPCLAKKRRDLAIKRSDGTLYDEGDAGACRGAGKLTIQEIVDAAARAGVHIAPGDVPLPWVVDPERWR